MNETRSLSDLIDKALTEHRVDSGRRLADIAQRKGYDLAHTTINGIRAGTYKSRPEPATIKAIAWLARVTDEEAFTAAGLRVPGPPFAEELPPGVDYLSPEKRRAVIGLLRVLIKDEEVMGNVEHPTPTTEAGGASDAGTRPRKYVRKVQTRGLGKSAQQRTTPPQPPAAPPS